MEKRKFSSPEAVRREVYSNMKQYHQNVKAENRESRRKNVKSTKLMNESPQTLQANCTLNNNKKKLQ